MRVLDLCAGRLGIARVFAERGHQVTAVDLVEPPEIPAGVTFLKADILTLKADWVRDNFDFGWASTPCDQFSLHGMKHFHPNPPYPALGIELFCHARSILTASGVPFVMENVRSAQEFVGDSSRHCGPFHLWGNSIPPLLPKRAVKGLNMGRDKITGKRIVAPGDIRSTWSGSKPRIEAKARNATIPPELANCVADYAETLHAHALTT